ncbi:DUF6789 family protein [Desulfosporosinus meridiei]|uniref:Uncharacterized protein n=1 Tax=Desulfosporosinus meridiei (strain ATCC BAA-275 / DSM 13257 / KCTC 12902 / NCIMB 13706 / S10) TaxID=768704 RepID=J7ITD3_DESMD|nr:DUF6789 family protein [Desulfosporosinus meridiei]AFQ43424.1 hypothetical protein Desmer_1431 [Desulfosporosinus meridiei DSM 13257]
MKVLDNLNRVARYMNVSRNMKDSIPVGFLSGLVGTLAMDLSNIIFKKSGVSEKTYAQYAGSVMISPFRLLFKENRILGQILHLITGSIMGIPLFTVLKKTGKDNYLFKGAIYGTFTWELLYSFGLRYRVFRTKAYSTRTHMTTLIDNLVYGFSSAATMVFLTDKSVFPHASKKQMETRQISELSQSSIDPRDEFLDDYSDEVRLH